MANKLVRSPLLLIIILSLSFNSYQKNKNVGIQSIQKHWGIELMRSLEQENLNTTDRKHFADSRVMKNSSSTAKQSSKEPHQRQPPQYQQQSLQHSSDNINTTKTIQHKQRQKMRHVIAAR